MKPRGSRFMPASVLTVAALALGAAGAMALGGCSRPLLSPAEERSPFDRYDAVRGQHAPQYIENEYGRREPNLRGRLAPRS